MEIEDYKKKLDKEFSKIVRKAIEEDGWNGDELLAIQQPAHRFYKDWGFQCMSDAWSACVPRCKTLTLEKWCKVIVQIDCWQMEVSCEAFSMAGAYVHITVKNKGTNQLPFTSTGYRSYFVSLDQFQDGKTVMDFLRQQLPETTQLSLF